MPTDIFKMLEEYSSFFGRGFILEMAPKIAEGALIELLRKRSVDVEKASAWIQADYNLWNGLELREQENLKKISGRVKDLSWMDFNWAVNAMKTEFPALASLFLGWTKAKNWLTRQIDIIKKEVSTSR